MRLKSAGAFLGLFSDLNDLVCSLGIVPYTRSALPREILRFSMFQPSQNSYSTFPVDWTCMMIVLALPARVPLM